VGRRHSGMGAVGAQSSCRPVVQRRGRTHQHHHGQRSSDAGCLPILLGSRRGRRQSTRVCGQSQSPRSFLQAQRLGPKVLGLLFSRAGHSFGFQNWTDGPSQHSRCSRSSSGYQVRDWGSPPATCRTVARIILLVLRIVVPVIPQMCPAERVLARRRSWLSSGRPN
jgi:hypothetical protein